MVTRRGGATSERNPFSRDASGFRFGELYRRSSLDPQWDRKQAGSNNRRTREAIRYRVLPSPTIL